MVKVFTVNILELFPTLSLIIIVILLYVPGANVLKRIVLLPRLALLVSEEAPVITIVPDSSV